MTHKRHRASQNWKDANAILCSAHDCFLHSYMAHDQVHIKARIHFLTTEEGGRTTPLLGKSSYRPNHNFFGAKDSNMTIGFINLGEGEKIMPGDTIEKEMNLLVWPELIREIFEGREWRIQEGAHLVGIGTVLKVFDQES